MLEGYVDRIRGNSIEGWVWDSLEPNKGLAIALLSNKGEVLSVTVADEFRGDVFAAGKGNGAHGFCLSIPDSFDPKGLRVIAFESGFELNGSPIVTSSSIDNNPQETNLDIFEKFAESRQLNQFLFQYINELQNNYVQKFSLLGERLRATKTEYGVLKNISNISETKDQTKLTDIIVLPPIDWFYRVQRPQRLAVGLANLGFRVWYISPQMLPIITAKPSYLIYDEPSPNVFLVKLRCNYPHPEIGRYPLADSNLSCLLASFLNFIEEYQLKQICWLIGSASWWPLVNKIGNGLSIYDCMDWHAGFLATTPEFLTTEQALITNSNLIICSSQSLQKFCSKNLGRTDAILLRNATHPEMFCLDIPKINGRPKIGYIGAIEYWFDSNFLIEVARILPELDFVLVGHLNKSHEKLLKIPNIQCVGECKHQQVADYVSNFHVGIVPFQENELIKHTDPVKVYEYLAAGRPVVANALPEIERLKPWVKIATTPTKFANAILESLTEAIDPILAMKRKCLVMGDTWSARACFLQSIILSNLIMYY